MNADDKGRILIFVILICIFGISVGFYCKSVSAGLIAFSGVALFSFTINNAAELIAFNIRRQQ